MKYFSPDRTARAPLYQQIYQYFRALIEKGELRKGDKLPSKRAFAQRAGVSVITVETAYAQLQAEGYVGALPGSGFYVEELLLPGRTPGGSAHGAPPAQPALPAPPAISGGKNSGILCDYTTSGTDTASFPFSVWQKLSREVLSGSRQALLSPCPSAGTYELRRAIAGYLAGFRGLNAAPRQIVVGAGSEYLAGLAIKLLGREKLYGIENPGYPKIAKIFCEEGARVCPLPLDAQGLTLEGAQTLPDVLHLTPAHHFPTGVTMPVGRRAELLYAMAEKNGFIIEDDYDSEFRYKGQIPPTLFELDGGRRVICIGTFAKLLAPSLRISYMVLPEDLASLYEERFSFYACTVPVFEQQTLAAFIEGGYLERHVFRMKKIYKKRREAILSLLPEFARFRARVRGEDAGLHLLAEMPGSPYSEEELVKRARRAGVRLAGLGSYYAEGTGEIHSDPCLVLGFTGIDEEGIKKSVTLLKEAWELS